MAELLLGILSGLRALQVVRRNEMTRPSPLSQLMAEPIRALLTRTQWIARYGGQQVLDAEGFDVVPCVGCEDSICHGWRIVPRGNQA